MQDLYADHFGLGEPVDDHGRGQYQRQETESQSLPRFQRDYGDRDGYQHGGLELQAQKERDDYFTDETAAWWMHNGEGRGKRVKNKNQTVCG